MKYKYLLRFSFAASCLFSNYSYSSCASIAQCPAVTPSLLGENIVDHGAVGGGVDDSSAIACALHMAKTNSKKVIIPAGTFTIEHDICLPNNLYNFVQVEGVGWQSVIKHKSGDYAFQVGDGSTIRPPASVIFKNFRIQDVSNNSASGAIIYNNSRRSVVDHLRIDGYKSGEVGPTHYSSAIGGAAITYRNTWVHTLKDTMITSSYNGIYARGGDGWGEVNALNINNSDLEGTFNGVVLGENRSINITENTIEGERMNKAVICHEACKNLELSGNYFEYKGSSPAQILYIGNDGYHSGITVSNNYASFANTDSYIEVRNARGVEITGNSFVGQPNAGEAYIKISGNGTAVAYFNINNNFSGTNSSKDVEWAGANFDYIKFVDWETGGFTSYNPRYGTVFDNKTKTLLLGRHTTTATLP